MKRLTLVLVWVATLISALVVVGQSHNIRLLNNHYSQVQQQFNTLREQRGKLLLEVATLASYSRLEKIANSEWDMVRPTAWNTVLIDKGSLQ